MIELATRVRVVLNIVLYKYDTKSDKENKLAPIVVNLIKNNRFLDAISLIKYFRGLGPKERYSNEKTSPRAYIISLICFSLLDKSNKYKNMKLSQAIEVAKMNVRQQEVERQLIYMAMDLIAQDMHFENKIVCMQLRDELRKEFMSYK